MTKIRSGGCLCGSIRFEVTGEPGNPHTCSCDICQRHSGAPSLAWVEFERDVVTWTGEGGAPSTFRSSDYSSRAFCPVCGSTLGAIDDAPTVALSREASMTGMMRRCGPCRIPSRMSARPGRGSRECHPRIERRSFLVGPQPSS